MYLFFPLLASLHSIARRDALREEARLHARLPVDCREPVWLPE
jgi:hypothetical protein